MRIAVLGGGAWGTSLARVLMDRGHVCSLWVRNPEVAATIRVERQNLHHLPGVLLPTQLSITGSVDAALRGAELAVLAVPCGGLRALLGDLRLRLPGDVLVLIGTRGLEAVGPTTPLELAAEMLPQSPRSGLLALGGPVLASEVARGLPTTLVLAGPEGDARDAVRAALAGANLRVQTTSDVVGTEIASALRGVVALAAGLCEGLELGESARAMMLARGYAEMTALGRELGARPETFLGPVGLADLALACGSARSRDWQAGYLLGRGMSVTQLRAERRFAGAEVWGSTAAAAALGQARGVGTPLFGALAHFLASGRSVREALLELLTWDPSTGLAGPSQPDAFEVDQIDEGGKPFADRGHVQGAEAVQAEVFHRVRGEHRAEDHGGADVGRSGAPGAREPAHEAAGEGIPRAGGVDHRLDREGGRGEHAPLVEQQGPGVTPLDDDRPGTELPDGPRRGRKVRPPR
jgi:glycerol-3-phosphate dehydrogenase (NAD(P)+)